MSLAHVNFYKIFIITNSLIFKNFIKICYHKTFHYQSNILYHINKGAKVAMVTNLLLQKQLRNWCLFSISSGQNHAPFLYIFLTYFHLYNVIYKQLYVWHDCDFSIHIRRQQISIIISTSWLVEAETKLNLFSV